jgi:ATP-dependent exoDNAse (exonuclease V) beta subunit
MIYDKVQKKHRRLRGGDVAILCPTHSRLAAYRDALNEVGIRTRIDQEGWFESRIVQIAFHSLSFVADPMDGHAALYLAVTELGSYTLEGALRDIVNGIGLAEPFLDSLRNLSANRTHKTADTLVSETIAAMDLYRATSLWPEGAQARANLLRLQGEAREFMSANREALASGGIYGSGLKTFLSWLIKKKDVDKGNNQPVARALEEDAVTLATWHGSKGREWPVVAVCSMALEKDPRLPSFDVEYEDFSDLACILDKAKVAISPACEAEETAERFLKSLRDTQREESLRLLYVALTRAREKIIMEWPEYLGPDKNSYWNVLTAATAMVLEKGSLAIGQTKFPCTVIDGGRFEPTGFKSARKALDDVLPVIGRRAIKPGKMPEKLTPEAVTPSSMHGEEGGKVTVIITETYGAGVELTGDLAPMERGVILHRCFEIMGGRDVSIEVARKGTGYDLSEQEYQSVKKSVAELDAWITKKFTPLTVQREVPILALNNEKSVVSGVVDLLVETKEGLWIIDHKTDTSEDLEATFAQYYPQLMAYRDAVSAAMPGQKVLGMGVNWV